MERHRRYAELFPSEIPKSKSGMLCVRVYGDLRECIRAWAARNQILNKLPRVVAVTVKHLASECKKSNALLMYSKIGDMQGNTNPEPKPDQAKPRIFRGSRLPAHAACLDHELLAWFRLGLSGLDASALAAHFRDTSIRSSASRDSRCND